MTASKTGKQTATSKRGQGKAAAKKSSAKGTAKAMVAAQMKFAAAVTVAVAVAAGGTKMAITAVSQRATGAPAATVAATPVANVAPSPLWSPPTPNWTAPEKWGPFQNKVLFPLANGKDGEYTVGLDPAVTRRTYRSPMSRNGPIT